MVPKDNSRHMKVHHKEIAIKCNFKKHCPAYFHSLEERDKHVFEVHMEGKNLKEINCVYCEESFLVRAHLFQHVAQKHSEVEIKCSVLKCREYFRTQEDREKHFEEVHAEVENSKMYKCDLCCYKSNFKVNLKQHFDLKHGTENVKCSVCSKSFKSKFALKIHVKNVACKQQIDL